MADYNSAYTGSAVDQAVADTAEIGHFHEMFTSTSGILGKVDLNGYNVNPNTGDVSGLYYVQYAINTSDEKSVGFIYVQDEGVNYGGAGHTDIVSGIMYASTIRYEASTTSIAASYDTWNLGAGTAGDENLDMRIFGMWRFQHLR